MHGARLSIILGVLSISSPALAGPDWPESTDAGPLPSSATPVVGVGELRSIRGTLTGFPLAGPPDFEDMFLIKIANPSIFCAKTVLQPFDCCGRPFNVTQPTNFNTQLWIFKADGRGIIANDDDPADPPRSRVTSFSNDGSGAVITTPGLYYIAISGGPNNDPVSSTGNIFNQALATEISGPDGLGGPNPITGWTGNGPIGQYQILFCGAEFVDINEIPTTSEWGLIILTTAFAAAGIILILHRQRRALNT